MLRAELPARTPASPPAWLGYSYVTGQHPVQGQKNLETRHGAVPVAPPPQSHARGSLSAAHRGSLGLSSYALSHLPRHTAKKTSEKKPFP